MNEPAFDELARTLRAPLLRFIERRLDDRALAEDLVQETLLRVARGLPHFDGRSSVKTWVYSIAKHLVIDELRRAPHRHETVDIDAVVEPATTTSIEDSLADDEMSACVRRVIATLPGTDRAALRLHDLEHHDCDETAAALGVTTGTAKVRIHRARKRLKDVLEHHCDISFDNGSALHCEPSVSAGAGGGCGAASPCAGTSFATDATPRLAQSA